MTSAPILYLLWAGLAIALLIAAITDIRTREISNKLNLGIALAAPLAWLAAGMAPWPDMAIQLGIAVAVFAVFVGCFAFGMMGGGDVKLLGALALWLPWTHLTRMLLIMAIAGGILTLLMMIGKKIQNSSQPLEVPYGVAIAIGGFWIIGERFLNHFA